MSMGCSYISALNHFRNDLEREVIISPPESLFYLMIVNEWEIQYLSHQHKRFVSNLGAKNINSNIERHGTIDCPKKFKSDASIIFFGVI